MKILVTGGTSLLGASVARSLADAGHAVAVLQRQEAALGLPEFRGEITDPSLVKTAVAGTDAVVHLAARVGVTGTWSQFESTNVQGTRVIVEAAKAAGVERFVYISSPSVAHAGVSLAGVSPSLPADPANTSGHYATSKAMAELLALEASEPGFAVAAIRPHLVWGPGDRQLIGRIVERARAGRLAVVGSGAALIDTTYLDNAVDAICAAIERTPRIAGRAFVVSNGQPRSVRELFSRIVRAAGLEPRLYQVPYWVARSGGRLAEVIWERTGRTDDPPMTRFLAEQLATAHWFDQRETRQALVWSPRVDLDDGFRHLTQWFAAGSGSGAGRRYPQR